jgi:hypothetical protein
MSRYLPIVVGVVTIVVLTVVQSVMSDRFSDTNVTAEQRKLLLDKVPKEFGDWVGEDQEVTEDVRETAGAVGCVNRVYRNTRSGEQVRLWLIVGHAKDIIRHTPNICYRASGFTMRSENSALYPFVDAYPGQTQPAEFFTNTFVKEDGFSGRELVRVFWSWYKPSPDGSVVWQAKDSPRMAFGNTRALFKMYFTSVMRDPGETTEDSPCVRFGREFLPEVEKALTETKVGREPSEATRPTDVAATE